MFKPTAVYPQLINEKAAKNSIKQRSGFLLINQRDEIIYINQQARNFLGLMADEPMPTSQTFLSLVQAAYRCYPQAAWQTWPKRPSTATSRCLLYKGEANCQLTVKILEEIVIDGLPFWAVSMIADETNETAVPYTIQC